MRLSTIPFLALLLAGAGGCAATAQSQYPAAPGYGNPGQWAPLAQPGVQPGMPGLQPAFYPPPPVFPVNVPALLALQGRIPCAPKEVAPGTWATFDCAPFQAISRVLQYVPLMRYNFLPTGPVPAAVDHRAEGGEGPVKDQGAVGDCTAVSLSSAMDNALRRMGRLDVISALHIWSRYGIGVTGQAGDSNVDKTVTVEQVWQYDPVKACRLSRSPLDTCSTAYGVASGSEAFDPALGAEHANADANGRYRLAAIEQLHAKPADPGEIAGVLATGDDVWISFSVNDQAWMNRSLQNAVIPDYETVEDTGHAVVLAGYRTLPNGTKQFLIHNSWGPRWGEGGFGWISEAMVARYTRAAYHVRVAEGSRGGTTPGKAPSTPAAPGTPVAGGCPAGQVKEPIFGACVPSGFPGMPGLSTPGPSPAPSLPGKPQASCPQGQAPDVMTNQCANACPGGGPSVGGLCLPIPR